MRRVALLAHRRFQIQYWASLVKGSHEAGDILDNCCHSSTCCEVRWGSRLYKPVSKWEQELCFCATAGYQTGVILKSPSFIGKPYSECSAVPFSTCFVERQFLEI